MFHAFSVMDDLDPDIVVCLGDFVYADASSGTYNGETITNVREVIIRTVGASAYRPHYRSIQRSPQYKRMAARCPQLMTWHDHEIFDSYCYAGLTNFNKFFHPNSASYDSSPATVEQIPNSFSNAEKLDACNAIYTAARTAYDEAFGRTNPASGYEAQDVRWRLRVPGLVEMVCPDHLTYFDSYAGAEQGLVPTYYTNPPEFKMYNSAQNASRKIHYPDQQAWVLDSLADAESAGVPHKLLLLATQPYEHNADASNNPDTLAKCSTERDAITSAFGSLTGAMAISGDSHQFAVYKSGDMLCCNSGSLSSGVHQQGSGYNTNVIYKRWGNTGQPRSDGADSWCFHIADITPAKQVHTVVDAHTGQSIWGPHTVLAGEKATTERRTRLA